MRRKFWRRPVSSPDRQGPRDGERSLRRVVFGTMTSPIGLSILGGSLLAAVAAGIHLGESAVAMINPIYFQGPALHPRDRGAAIDERTLQGARPAPARPYGWGEGHAARAIAADCDDCDPLALRDAQDYSAVVPYFGGDEPPAEAAEVPSRVPEVRIVRGSDEFVEPAVPPKRNIERYAHFPLGYEESAFSAPLAEERAADDKDSYR